MVARFCTPNTPNQNASLGDLYELVCWVLSSGGRGGADLDVLRDRGELLFAHVREPVQEPCCLQGPPKHGRGGLAANGGPRRMARQAGTKRAAPCSPLGLGAAGRCCRPAAGSSCTGAGLSTHLQHEVVHQVERGLVRHRLVPGIVCCHLTNRAAASREMSRRRCPMSQSGGKVKQRGQANASIPRPPGASSSRQPATATRATHPRQSASTRERANSGPRSHRGHSPSVRHSTSFPLCCPGSRRPNQRGAPMLALATSGRQ